MNLAIGHDGSARMKNILLAVISLVLVLTAMTAGWVYYKISAYERHYSYAPSSYDRCQAALEGAAFMRSVTLFKRAEELERKSVRDCQLAPYN
jgi:hypothetical protein